ncbi:protein-glutamate methylesterase/protein-glutamine glutaminase [Marinibactrum halimedae]|uniref:Protein-glutamate methylesterase/protein-glutamine glutaminase n=1 Tax=Marinibactrum halimedae TaxID=1444977 RepID=A0AA37T546_9GAMM|nr:chemotaxis response regulator protein-glutamate methylesterase [Marinibactrum halimedae]MCD9459808.1 chemotaxis response regulator protein-glutamate methylesterase [Marinibactrum halimedae]GLS26999.1 hypothetical protein GCM10007877_27180 [Marinibactrum halimedae]
MTFKVLVVDDSHFFQERLKEMIQAHPKLKVVAIASNGREAVELAEQHRPDLITMDYEMPVMDGVTAVRQIMAAHPTPILMFSSLTYEGARTTLDALDAGAVDFLPKNFAEVSRDSGQLKARLHERLLAIVNQRGAASGFGATNFSSPSSSSQSSTQVHRSQATKSQSTGSQAVNSQTANSQTANSQTAKNQTTNSQTSRHLSNTVTRKEPDDDAVSQPKASAAAPQKNSQEPPRHDPYLEAVGERSATVSARASRESVPRLRNRLQLLAIGASTGGPVALTEVLTKLPANFPAPILLIQHMPQNFTQAFAERLDRLCQIRVKQASDGDKLVPGQALLAPGGQQMMVDPKSRSTVRILPGDDRLNYKPCVDVTFASAANAFGDRLMAIIMTGMGSDGCDGCRIIKQKGGVVWSQDKDSSVIYGMPMAVAKAGLTDRVVALRQFAPDLNDAWT